MSVVPAVVTVTFVGHGWTSSTSVVLPPCRRYRAYWVALPPEKREAQQVVVAGADRPPAGLRAIEGEPPGKALGADVGDALPP